jgi:hypothetical protein
MEIGLWVETQEKNESQKGNGEKNVGNFGSGMIRLKCNVVKNVA